MSTSVLAPLRYYSCGIQHFHIYNLSQHGDIHLNPGPRADVTFGLGRVDSINETTSGHVTAHPTDSNGVYSSVTAPSRLRQLTGHTVDNCLIYTSSELMKLRHCVRTSLSQEALSTVLRLKIRRHRGCRAGIRRKTRKQNTVQNYAEDRSVLPDIHHQYSQLPVDATSDHSSSTVVRTGTATPKAVVRAGSSPGAILTTIRPQICPTSSST